MLSRVVVVGVAVLTSGVLRSPEVVGLGPPLTRATAGVPVMSPAAETIVGLPLSCGRRILRSQEAIVGAPRVAPATMCPAAETIVGPPPAVVRGVLRSLEDAIVGVPQVVSATRCPTVEATAGPPSVTARGVLSSRAAIVGVPRVAPAMMVPN